MTHPALILPALLCAGTFWFFVTNVRVELMLSDNRLAAKNAAAAAAFGLAALICLGGAL